MAALPVATPLEADPRRRFPLGWVIVAVVLLALVVRTIDVLLIVFLATMLGIYLGAVRGVLERRLGMRHGVALLVAVILTLGALTGVVVLIVPPVAAQVQQLLSNLPAFLTTLEETVNGLLQRVPLLRRTGAGSLETNFLSGTITGLVGYAQHTAVPYLKRGLELVIEAVSVAVMAIYLARHPTIYTDGLVALVPPRRRPLARDVLADLGTTLRAWIVGQIVAMVFLGALTTAGLLALGVPYALAFGTFAGVAAIVPFFGTLFATVVPALFALGASGLPKALAVAALGVGVHLVEANFVAPVVMERQVKLPPVITIAGVLLIGKLFGFPGLIVAVPILAVVMVLVRHLLLGEVYGDPIDEAVPTGTRPVRAPSTITPDTPVS